MDHYVICVDGPVPVDALIEFPALSATPLSPYTTLEGELLDQAALAGVLDHLDQLGVEIVEVLKVPAPR